MDSQLSSTRLEWPAIWRLTLAHRRELVIAHILAVMAAATAVPIPLLMPILVDEVLLDQPGAVVSFINGVFPHNWQGPTLYVLAVLALTLLLRFATLGFGVWQSREFSLIGKDIIFRLRRHLLEYLQFVSMRDYETLGSGTVASHLVTDLDAVDEFIAVTLSRFLIAALSLIGTAAILLWLHWQLGLVVLLLNPMVIYLTMALSRRVKQLKTRENRAFELFQQALTETLDAMQQIRAHNRERFFIRRTVDRAQQVKVDSAAFAWKNDAANRLSFTIFLYGFDVFRAVAMLMVVFSDLSIGEMLAVFAYLWFMIGPVQDVVSIQYGLAGARAALARINKLLEMRLEPRYEHQADPFAGQRTVSLSLRGVRFSYGEGAPVLDGVDLDIAAGEKVAIVGTSGGGKSTLVQLLLGLHTPDSGHVCYGGVPIEQIGLEVVRDHVTPVLQHPAIFDDSVRNNLTLGLDKTDTQLWAALETAALDDVIRATEAGLDSRLGRDGVRLSGGQRQRLALARMVIAEPQVVILDEATSALDAETEARVLNNLAQFLSGRTTLIVAHRLSAIREADRAFVFDQGRIVESGRHDALLSDDGIYARLYGTQGA